MLEKFPEESIEIPETPEAAKFSTIRDEKDEELLDKTRAKQFHHVVAQIIFTDI